MYYKIWYVGLASKTFPDFSPAHIVWYLMPYKLKSDGLGGFFGISHTLKLGAVKQFRALHLYIILLPVLLTLLLNTQAYNIISLSMILSLQRANETFKSRNTTAAKPYRRILII